MLRTNHRLTNITKVDVPLKLINIFIQNVHLLYMGLNQKNPEMLSTIDVDIQHNSLNCHEICHVQK